MTVMMAVRTTSLTSGEGIPFLGKAPGIWKTRGGERTGSLRCASEG
jgi:hypothetical protein